MKALPASRFASGLASLRVLRAMLDDPLAALPAEPWREPLRSTELFGQRVIHLSDPGLVRDALVGNAERLDKGRRVRAALMPALGEGLLTAEASHWRWQRRAVAPLFRPDRVDGLLPLMLEEAERLRDRLAALPPGAEFVAEAETTRCTFRIIAAAMLSGEGDADPDEIAHGVTDYVRQVNRALVADSVGLPRWVPYPGRRRAMRAVRTQRAWLQRVIAARRAAAASGANSGERARADLLDRLLNARDDAPDAGPDAGRAMTDREIVDNLMTFLTAGHETTALSLAWTLDLLARHPAIQDRVAAEIRAVSGGAALEPAMLPRLSLLRRVIDESMRLYPPAPMLSREVRDGFQLGDTAIAPGTVLVVPVTALHRNPRWWPEPERFDPDRFLPERADARPRSAFMPFGVGPRVCIGAGFATSEATAILAVLLAAFRFEPRTAMPPPARMDLTLRPATPLLLGVRRRANPVESAILEERPGTLSLDPAGAAAPGPRIH